MFPPVRTLRFKFKDTSHIDIERNKSCTVHDKFLCYFESLFNSGPKSVVVQYQILSSTIYNVSIHIVSIDQNPSLEGNSIDPENRTIKSFRCSYMLVSS